MYDNVIIIPFLTYLIKLNIRHLCGVDFFCKISLRCRLKFAIFLYFRTQRIHFFQLAQTNLHVIITITCKSLFLIKLKMFVLEFYFCNESQKQCCTLNRPKKIGRLFGCFFLCLHTPKTCQINSICTVFITIY